MKVIYVGADVHKDSTTVEMQDENGQVIAKSQIRTGTRYLQSMLESLDGRVVLAVEESSHSRWIYEKFSGVVDEVLVCNPQYVRPSHIEDKDDDIDAHWLAKKARLGELELITQRGSGHRALKEIAKAYRDNVRSSTSVKNKIHGIYRTHGSWPGSIVLDEAHRKDCLQLIDCEGSRVRLEILYEELDFIRHRTNQTRKRFIAAAKQNRGWRSVVSIPGFGPINTAKAIAWIGEPGFFRTDRQLRKYAGLAVVRRSSSNYDKDLKRQNREFVVGLNQNFCRPLKAVFKDAAHSAAITHQSKYPNVRGYYMHRCDAHGKDVALVDVARKFATLVLVLWKNQEVYDPEKIRWTQK